MCEDYYRYQEAISKVCLVAYTHNCRCQNKNKDGIDKVKPVQFTIPRNKNDKCLIKNVCFTAIETHNTLC